MKEGHTFYRSLLDIKKHTIFHRVYYFLISFSFFYRIKRFLKYAMIGFVGTGADVALIYIFVNLLGIYYLIVTLFSDFVKTFINFNLHKRYAFKDETKTFSKRNFNSFGRYYIINLTSVVIIFIIVIFLVEFLHFGAILAKLTADLIMNLTRFTTHKSIVFERPIELGKQ
jgi:putative flippase GtrA